MDLHSHHSRLVTPPPAQILGIRLRPYSVGHCRLLAYLDLGRAETLPDLVAALLICHYPASQLTQERLASRRFRWTCTLRVFWIGFALRVLASRYACGTMILFLRARQQWDEYLQYYHSAPALVPADPSQGSPVLLDTPRLAHVEHTLTGQCGLRPHEVLDLPLNEAYWRDAVAREASGQYRIVGTEELEGDAYDAAQAEADRFEEAWRKANP